MAAFRDAVAASFLFKFYVSTLADLGAECAAAPVGVGAPVYPPVPTVSAEESSAAVVAGENHVVSYGRQMFDVPGEAGAGASGVPEGLADVVGTPVPHTSSLLQVRCCVQMWFVGTWAGVCVLYY
jgi:hypothetical protein